MPKHTGLGKGLDALIPTGFQPENPPLEAATPASGGVLTIPVEKIVPNPRQPRSHFDQDALRELADSIKEHGIIQPLLVSRDDDGSGYVLVAGERRWQAARLAGLMEVPVLVRQTTDQQRLELALIENVQRADLNPLEEAFAYRNLAEDFGLSHDEIASRVGKNRVTITNTMRLLRLTEAVQQALVDRRITEGHARALLGLEAPQAMDAALATVVKNHLSVRDTEELVRKLLGERPAPKVKSAPNPNVADLARRLESTLGTKVSLKSGKSGNGTLTLYFYSEEELEALLSRLMPE